MTEQRITRDGHPPLAFDGEEIGFATSEEPGKGRWFEVTIYRTATGRWVVHTVGVSTLPGEDDRHHAVVCEQAGEIVEALYRVGDAGPYIPRTSMLALAEAARTDEDVAAVYVERV